ncbi:hypothetical protein ABZU76_39400 [Amycolatopsis sp. NPDC005232]|uniref:hypothetical protein n=1 Tax=Amycolatopsis sp. NPDC005232 TaxID=3157027 RepID=UPI0033AE6C7A
MELFTGITEMDELIGRTQGIAQVLFLGIDGMIRNRDYLQWEWTLVNETAGETHGWEVIHLDGDLIDMLVIFSTGIDVVMDGIDPENTTAE